MKLRIALGVAAVVITRLCHSGVIWVEEAYPAAGAIQMLNGRVPYRDFWFDKPPLTPLIYALTGAYPGVGLRLLGALFVMLCAALAFALARTVWGEREGWLAAALIAFSLTFDTPAAVFALAPDLLMLAPHLAAVWLASRGRAVASGAMAGVAFLINPKAVFVAAACLAWPRAWRGVVTGFAAVTLMSLGVLAALGALGPYWRQVWVWGGLYARSGLFEHPLGEALTHTAAWAGFHLPLAAGAAVYFWRERGPGPRRLALWTALAFAGVLMGWRYFPRYYFLLLAPAAIAGARGLARLTPRWRMAALALFLIPLVRFGPRTFELGRDWLAGRESQWTDLAMSQDSARAARLLAGEQGTLLVWGYRPDIFMRTRLAAGSPFLDSQPLTGVIADRHLTRADVSAPALAAENRRRLAATSPDVIVDGLGLYNPALAITRYPDLAPWLANYHEVARTAGCILYRR